MMTRWKVALLGACSCAVVLASCGGGDGGAGGGSGSVVTPTLARLNDTGVTADQCFAAGSFATFAAGNFFPGRSAFASCSSPEARALSTRQDGQGGRDAVAATDASSDGKLGFQFSAVPGGCVRDEVTGLTWESKTTDVGLHDHRDRYSNLGDGSHGDASEFVSAVNLAGLCGAADWRLPTLQELHSLLDYGAMAAKPHVGEGGVYIDTNWFPNLDGDYGAYWTSTLTTPVSPVNSRGRYVSFVAPSDGVNFSRGDRHEHYAVRLVRGGDAWVAAETRFTPSADAQEVTDRQTGLVWRRCLEGTHYVAGSCPGTISAGGPEAALRLAETVAASTGVGWRLPNAKELLGLTQPGRDIPAYDPVAFPATPTQQRAAWSSTPCSPNLAASSAFDTQGASAEVSCNAPGATGVLLVRDPS